MLKAYYTILKKNMSTISFKKAILILTMSYEINLKPTKPKRTVIRELKPPYTLGKN